MFLKRSRVLDICILLSFFYFTNLLSHRGSPKNNKKANTRADNYNQCIKEYTITNTGCKRVDNSKHSVKRVGNYKYNQ